jgi:hypothetical protein
MLKVFQKSGLGLQTKHGAGVVNVALNVTNDITGNAPDFVEVSEAGHCR